MTLHGRRIVAVRTMTDAQCEREGWDRPACALVLDDGTVLYPARDPEGNGPGVLFGWGPGARDGFVVDGGGR